MMQTIYPATLELEIYQNGTWIVEKSYVVNNTSSLNSKMCTLKSLYNYKNKEYRIMLTCQSKMNKKVPIVNE